MKKPSPAMITYFCAIYCVFPLFFTNYYYNLQLSKSLFFILATGITFAFVLLNPHSRISGDSQAPADLLKVPGTLQVLLFCLSALLSACLSPYGRCAFTGEGGRYIGFFLILFMCAGYFLFSRESADLAPCYGFLLARFSLTALLGILQYAGLDLAGFSRHVPERLTGMYLSTVGNINVFSGYISMMTAFCAGLYFTTANKFLLLPSLLGYTALFAGNSDSGFLSIALILFLLPLFAQKQDDLLRILDQLLLFSLSCGIAYGFSSHGIIPFQGLSQYFSRPIFFLPLALALIALILPARHHTVNCHHIGLIRKVYALFLLSSLITVAALVLLVNLHLISFPPLLIDDRWGSYRGYIWKKVLEIYRAAPPLRKLLGYGPDTLKLLLSETCREEMLSVTGKLYDSAHNDFLQYLITTGIAGVLCWLSVWLSILIRSLTDRKPEMLPWLLVLIAYLAQTMLIPTQPITAPLAFTAAGICSGMVKKNTDG